jgi:hypothetical protein
VTANETGSPLPTSTALSFQWQYLATGGTWVTFGTGAGDYSGTGVYSSTCIANCSSGTGTYSSTFTSNGITTAGMFLPAASGGLQIHVLVTDTNGLSVSSDTVLLYANAPASVTGPASSLAVNQDQQAQLTVSGTSANPSGSTLHYQWYDGGACSNGVETGGTAVVNSSNITGATGPSLTIANSAGTNAGTYYAIVSNTYGNNGGTPAVSSVCSGTETLTVNLPPTFTVNPVLSETIGAGGDGSFTVSATGTAPVTIAWQYSTDGGTTWSPFPVPTHGSVSTSTSGGVTTSTLTTVALGPGADGFKFEAIASNTAANGTTTNTSTSSAGTVYVIKPPTITAGPAVTSPVGGTGYEGGSATLTVSATLPTEANGCTSGSCTLSYQWYPCTSATALGSAIPEATSATLVLPSLTQSSNAQYCVVVTNTDAITGSPNASVTGGPVTLAVTPGYWIAAGTLPSGSETFMRSVLLPNGHVMAIGSDYNDPSDPTDTHSLSINIDTTPGAGDGLDTWVQSSAVLPNPLQRPTATLLPTGAVLIAGGLNEAIGADSTASYLFTEGSDTLPATTNPMNTPRDSHAATLLGTGQVLVTGGYNSGVILNSFELYDPASQTWTQPTAHMVSARYRHAATLLQDGTVLVTGGQSTNGSLSALSSAEIYTPGTGTTPGTWTATGSMNFNRVFHAATLLPDGTVLITGGINNAGVSLQSAEIYYPVSYTGPNHATLAGTFQLLSAPMVSARNQHTATLLPDGNVLIAGGAATSYQQTSEYYNPVAQTFTETANLITARDRASAWLLQNGKVLVEGGSGTGDVSLNSAEKFNDQSGGALPTAPTIPTATIVTNQAYVTPDGVTAPAAATATCGGSSSQPGVTYAWTILNGVINSGQGTYSINFSANNTPGGIVTLYCLATSSLGIPGADTYVEPIALAATIASSPTSLNVITGSTASFTATATGNPAPAIAWWYSTNGGSTWSLFPIPAHGSVSTSTSGGVTTSTLTTVALGPGADGFEFEAIASSAYGLSTSGLAAIRVNTQPTVTVAVNPSNGMQNVGGAVTFTATASGDNNPTYSYVWHGPSGVISGATTNTLTLTDITTSAAGSYYVVVTNTNALSGTTSTTQSTTSGSTTLGVYTPATIASSPTSLNLITGGTASFTATATGNPAPTIAWQYSTNSGATWSPFPIPTHGSVTTGPITGGTTSTLTTVALGPGADGYEFEAIASNAAANGTTTNTSTSGLAVIRVNTQPTVTVAVNPSNGMQDAGGAVTFTATASGDNNPTYSYVWHGPGGVISGATTNTLTLTGITTSAAGSYYVVVTNTNALSGTTSTTQSTTSGSTTLGVYTPATIASSPTSLSIAVGSTASFIATATGNPAPAIAWWYSTNGGSTWSLFPIPAHGSVSAGPITGGTTSTLSTVALGPGADGYKFEAIASNTAANGTTTNTSTSGSATVTVVVAPANVSVTPTSQTVAQGAGATFTASGTPAAGTTRTYAWYNGASCSGSSIGSGPTLTFASTTNPLLGQAGSYSMLATDSSDSITASAACVSATLAVTVGGWTPVDPQSLSRYEALSLVLPNGTFWVAGGQNDSGLRSDDSIYTSIDATHGTWATNEAHTFAAGPHLDGTATLLPNGSILIAGGSNGQDGKTGVEIYDPSTDTFSRTTNSTTLSQPTTQHVAALLNNGLVLIAGGTNGWSDTYYNNAFLYNPGTDSVAASSGTLSMARAGSRAVTLNNGKVLIVGGEDVNGVDNLADLYTPATDSFATVTGGMASPRLYHTATLLPSGKVLIAGGSNGTQVLSTLEVYDPTANTFTPLGSMSTARMAHSAVLLANGNVLIFGGSDNSGNVLQSAEVIDPNYAGDSGTLTIPATSMNSTRELDSATLLPNGTVLAAGGYSGTASLASAEVWGALEGYTTSPSAPNATITVNYETVPTQANLTPGLTGNNASVPSDSTASYFWSIANGSITAGQNTDQITFTAGASGTMTIPVLVTDIYGFSAIGTANPMIFVPPVISSFTASSYSITSPAGITLNAQHTGGTSAQITDNIDNNVISVSSNNFTTLTLNPSVTTAYTLTVFNGMGGSVTSQLTVNVITTKPSITTQPSSVSACANSTATFTVVSPSLSSCQWYYSSTPTTSAGIGTCAVSGSGSGPYTYQLSIPGVTSGNDGNYFLQLTNSAGATTSSQATLKVGTVITQQPQSTSVSASQTATFSVSVSNVDAVNYQWYRIPSGGSAALISGANSSIYTTPPVTSANNNDQYYVVVSDAGGCSQLPLTSASATLTVNSNTSVPPTITVQPTGQDIYPAGNSATFTATASSVTNTYSYQWYVIPAGKTSPQAVSGFTGASGTQTSGSSISLRVPTTSTASANNGDQYYVLVTNTYGQSASLHAQLATGGGALIQITDQPQTQYVGVGDTAVFHVTATTTSPSMLSYQWYVTTLGSTSATAVTGATTATLEIPNAQSSSTGSVYYAVVSSSDSAAGSITSKTAGLFVGSLGNVTDKCAGGVWQLNGDASQYNNPGCAGILLVPNAYGQSSSIFWPTVISTAKFSASFTVAISANTFPADGFSMVLADPTQGASKYSMGSAGSGLGAQGIPGFVLGFDTYYNSGLDPCQPPYLGVGQGASNLWENPWTSTNCYLPNGSGTYNGNNAAYTNSTHNYVVTVVNGNMNVTMDGNQVFSGAVSMPPVGYLGFTGSTGGAKEQVVISNMVVTLSADTTPTLLSIAVTPAAPVVTIGTPQGFVATGTYSDGTTQDLSGTVSWTDNSGGSGLWTGSNWTAPFLGMATDTITATATGAGVAGASVAGTTTVTTIKALAAVTLGGLSQTYTGSALAATASTSQGSLAVSLTYNGSSTTPTAAGSYTVVGTIIDANYAGTATGTLVIGKATATVTLGGLSQTYTGSALAATAGTTPSGLTVNLTYNGSTTVPTTAGSYTVVGTISDSNYQGTRSGTLVIGKATPTITWPTASAITYGQTLANSTLSGGSATPTGGSFAFTTPSTAPGAGTASQSVTYTPADTTDYSTGVSTVSVLVNRATPTITWATPAAITYGTALSGTQLNASSTVAGTFVYTPASGTVLTAGSQSLSVTLTPTDSTDYTTATSGVTLTVNQATPTVNAWPTASAITVGQTLASSTLTGGSTTPTGGSFAFTTPSTVPELGTSSESVTYTPADTTDYTTAVSTVSVTVVAAPVTPSITIPTYVTASTGGYTATISNTSSPASTYTWSIADATGTATLTGTPTGSTATFTAGIVGSEITLHATATNAAGATGAQGISNPATVVEAPPNNPTVTVTSSATVVTSGTVDAYTTGNTASFTDGSASSATDTYSCSVSGGSSITAGQGTLSITFTAGASGDADPTCTITNAAGSAGTSGSTSTPINGLLSFTSPTPNNMYVAEGATQQYSVMGTFSDTSTANLTNAVTWSESDTDSNLVASIGNTSGTQGRATAGSVTGVATIIATLGGTPHTTNLTVGAWTVSASTGLRPYYEALPMMELNNGSTNILWLAGGRSANGSMYSGDNIDVLPYVSTNSWTNTVTLNPSPVSPSYSYLQYAHVNGTATLVPSGQVIIAGGNYSDIIAPQTAIEVYSPTVPAYTVSSAVLPTATTGHVAALLTNGPNAGDVLIAGGWDGSSVYYTNAYFYNPTGSTINSLLADSITSASTQIGTARYGSTATTLNDHRILIVGGTDATNADTAVDIYDTNSTGDNTDVTYPPSQYTRYTGGSGINDVFAWAICSDTPVTGSACLNTARTGHTATLLPTTSPALPTNGKVLIAGGTNAGGVTGSLEVFDPTLNSGAGGFVNLGSLITARMNASAVPLANNMVLIFGGTGSNGNSLSSAEVVDANWVADGWSSASVAVASLNLNRTQAASILLPDGTSVLVAGGNIGTALAPVDDSTDAVEVFSTTTPVP